MTGTATLGPESEIEKKIGKIEKDISDYISQENKSRAEAHIFRLRELIAENLKAVYPTPASVDNAHIQHVEAVRENLILHKLAEAKKLADSRDIGYNSKLQDVVNFITTSFDGYKHRTNYLWAMDAGKKIDNDFKSKEFGGYYKKLHDEIYIRMLKLDRNDAINLHKQVVELDDCVSEFGRLVNQNYHPCAHDSVLADHIEALRGSVMLSLFRGAFNLAQATNTTFVDNFLQADLIARADIAGGNPDPVKYCAWIKSAKEYAEKKFIDAVTDKAVKNADSSL